MSASASPGIKPQKRDIFHDLPQHSYEHVEIKPIPIVQAPDPGAYEGADKQAQDEALLHIRKGDFAGAVKAYEKIVKKKPGDTKTANILAALYVHLFENDKAIKLLRDITRKDKNDFIALNNLAACYMRQFEYKKAEKPLIKALSLAPNTAEINHNAGVYYQRQSNHQNAYHGFANAIKLKGLPRSYCGMGFNLLSGPDKAGAEKMFKKALELDPQNDIALHGLYYCETHKGDTFKALNYAARCVAMKPDNPRYMMAFTTDLENAGLYKVNTTIISAFYHALKYGKISMRRFFSTWLKILQISENFPVLNSLLQAEDPVIDNETFEKLLPELENDYFYLGLKNLFIRDLKLEEILTNLRRAIIAKRDILEAAPVGLLSGLAVQCFFNEYLYPVSDDEKKELEKLEQELVKSPSDSPLPYLIYACYTPLYGSALEDQYVEQAQHFKNDLFDELVDLQILQRREESQIKDKIKSFGSIEDEISQAVKSQYEENPYPRWNHIVMPDAETLLLHKKSAAKAKRQVLVAGCGTGQQSVAAAYGNKNAQVTAFDLSRASLAYAIRKTREVGLTNVEYLMGDILEADQLGKKFDEIFCSGVLHHMKDPMAGWHALNNILKPGGTMQIALYSELARSSVRAAREFIREKGYTSSTEDIRAFREEIKNLPEDHPLRAITHWNDFFNISMCRDLAFHVQEHQFTIPQIKECLDELGLEFIRFLEGNKRVRDFRKSHGPEQMADLDAWHAYETRNPKTFTGMYQFICRKPA